MRIARSASACALPRPSAIASAKLPKSTVSHSQIATVKVNQAGSLPPPGASPPNAWTIQISVVSTAPISTTNMTGLRTMSRGSSLPNEAAIAAAMMSRSNSERSGRSVIAAPPAHR